MGNTLSNDTDALQALGTHTVQKYSEDTIIFRAQGDISIEEVRTWVKFVLSLPRPDKGIFYLSNLSHARHQSQQAAGEFKKVAPGTLRAIGVVGATFAHRVLIDTMIRSARFFKVSLPQSPMRFFATEEEALAWFERIRRGEE